jgi:hypothetical protein
MTDSPPVSGPPARDGAVAVPAGLGQILWRDPLLRLAFLGVGVCITYFLAVVLLHPAWGGPVTDWLLALLAWPELLGVLLFTGWLRAIGRSDVLTWSLLSVVLLCYPRDAQRACSQ